MVKIAVSGSKGRMGQRIIKLIKDDPQLKLAGGFDIGDDPRSAIKACDVLIEFTTPDATMANLKIAKDLGKGIVIGTTALDKSKTDLIKKAAGDIPVVFSPNMSVGVNLFFKTAGQIARVFGKDYIPSISETHHVHKKDAPSGTAKRLLSIIAKESGIEPGKIKVDSKREGEVVGDHTVIFEGKEEKIEITHHAKSRDVFARGAIVAAVFIAKKRQGFYSMADVLGI